MDSSSSSVSAPILAPKAIINFGHYRLIVNRSCCGKYQRELRFIAYHKRKKEVAY